jgi:hypothetical protein
MMTVLLDVSPWPEFVKLVESLCCNLVGVECEEIISRAEPPTDVFTLR